MTNPQYPADGQKPDFTAPENQGWNSEETAPTYQEPVADSQPAPSYDQQAAPAYGEQAAQQPSADYAQQGYAQAPNYGQAPGYQQQGYGYAPQPNYGYNQGYQQPSYQATEHPQATLVLVLGIVGFFTTITAFIAWYIGGKAKKEIESGQSPYVWDGSLKIGYWIGKILGIVTIVGIALMIVFMILAVVAGAFSY